MKLHTSHLVVEKMPARKTQHSGAGRKVVLADGALHLERVRSESSQQSSTTLTFQNSEGGTVSVPNHANGDAQ
jgi:hypothetical protein